MRVNPTFAIIGASMNAERNADQAAHLEADSARELNRSREAAGMPDQSAIPDHPAKGSVSAFRQLHLRTQRRLRENMRLALMLAERRRSA